MWKQKVVRFVEGDAPPPQGKPIGKSEYVKTKLQEEFKIEHQIVYKLKKKYIHG